MARGRAFLKRFPGGPATEMSSFDECPTGVLRRFPDAMGFRLPAPGAGGRRRLSLRLPLLYLYYGTSMVSGGLTGLRIWKVSPGSFSRMTGFPAGAVVFLAAFFLLLSHVQAADAPDSTCAGCHWGSELRSARLLAPSFYVDAEKLKKSVHGAFPCTACHTGDWTVPHKFSKIQPVQCGTCHAKAAEAFRKSLHSMMMAPGAETSAPGGVSPPRPVTCSSCHGEHYIQKANNPESPIFSMNQVKTCGGCHKRAVQQSGRPEFGKRISEYVDSVHGRAVLEGGLVSAAVCTSCHRSHDILPPSNPDSSISRSQAPATCGKCHLGIVRRMEKDAHGLASTGRREGGTPTCIDCHTSHTIARTALAGFRLANPERCGHCHERQLHTYRLSQHGKAGLMHSAEAADCSDCHIAHSMKPVNQMRSDAKEFAAVCGKCHHGAGPLLISFQPHADPADRRAYPLLYWAKFGMHWLVVSVMGFFGIHTLLWFPRSWWGRA